MSVHSRMVDTCTITRPTTGVFDPNTGTYTSPAGTAIYEGPCAVIPMGIQDRNALIGERAATVMLYNAYLPLSAGAVQKDDTVVVTNARDPQLENRTLEVESFVVSSYQKVRHLILEEVR